MEAATARRATSMNGGAGRRAGWPLHTDCAPPEVRWYTAISAADIPARCDVDERAGDSPGYHRNVREASPIGLTNLTQGRNIPICRLRDDSAH